MSTKVICPNCSGEAVLDGNVIACEGCNATYKITKLGEAKVDKLNISERLSKIEKQLAEQKKDATIDNDVSDPDEDEE